MAEKARDQPSTSGPKDNTDMFAQLQTVRRARPADKIREDRRRSPVVPRAAFDHSAFYRQNGRPMLDCSRQSCLLRVALLNRVSGVRPKQVEISAVCLPDACVVDVI
jgi:hypothetical protein